MLDDTTDVVGNHVVGGFAVGAHGAGEIGRAGDDVARGASVELSHGHDGGFVRADLARNDGLQRIDDLGGDHDGVVAALRHSAVARRTAHIDAEPVGVGHARARLTAYGAGVHFAPDVHGKRAIHAFAHTGADHHLGSLAVFLGRLEHDADLAVDIVGHMAQDLQGAKHHGNMAVMAAGMHKAFVDTGEFLAGLLGDGQGVDVGAQQDTAARRAVLAVGIGGGAAQGRHEAGFKRALGGDVHGIELIGDVGGGAYLGQARLGVFMEMATLPDDIGLEFGGNVMDALSHFLWRACIFIAHDLLCASFRHSLAPLTFFAAASS